MGGIGAPHHSPNQSLQAFQKLVRLNKITLHHDDVRLNTIINSGDIGGVLVVKIRDDKELPHQLT